MPNRHQYRHKQSRSNIDVETTYLVVLDDIPDCSERVHSSLSSIGMIRRDYYRDCVAYIRFCQSFISVNLAIIDKGDREAVNLRVELEICSNNTEILLDGDEVDEPKVDLISNFQSANSPIHCSSYSVYPHDDKWVIYNGLDRLHAKRTLGLDGTIYIRGKESVTIKVKATVFFDGQSVPYEQELKIKVNCVCLKLNWDDVYKEYLET